MEVSHCHHSPWPQSSQLVGIPLFHFPHAILNSSCRTSKFISLLCNVVLFKFLSALKRTAFPSLPGLVLLELLVSTYPYIDNFDSGTLNISSWFVFFFSFLLPSSSSRSHHFHFRLLQHCSTCVGPYTSESLDSWVQPITIPVPYPSSKESGSLGLKP